MTPEGWIHLAAAVETNLLATWLRSSAWGYPAVETVHIAALALLFGAAVAFDLRLLGVGSLLPVEGVARFLLPLAQKRDMLSRYGLPEERAGRVPQILAVEKPMQSGCRDIRLENDALVRGRDVWVECDHFLRHRRPDVGNVSGERAGQGCRFRAVKKPFDPFGFTGRREADLVRYNAGWRRHRITWGHAMQPGDCFQPNRCCTCHATDIPHRFA